MDDEPLRQVRGESNRADLNFDAQGRLDHAVLRGGVRTFERVRVANDAKEPWSERDLTADNLDLVLKVPEAAQIAATSNDPGLRSETIGTRPILREATATGSARLTSVASSIKALSGAACGDTASRCAGTTTTKLSGDRLQAHFLSPHGVAELSTVRGSGHTAIEQINPKGVDQTSSGQRLDATFRESAKGKGQAELASAVQEGGVLMTRSAPAKSATGGAAEDAQRATGDRASFDADTDRLTLTGNVHVSDAGSSLSASRVVMEQDTGDAAADGGVKVSYLQPGSAQPAYVIAARAELSHDAGRATFYGRAAAGGASNNSRLARLWQPGTDGQGGSQIEAPVLVFEQEQKRLTARAETAGVPGQVHAALEDSEGKDSGKTKQGEAVLRTTVKSGPTLTRSGVARIISSQMVYSDIDRRAEFTGGVQVFEGDGAMRSQQATVYLSPADAGKGKAKPSAPANGTKMPGSPGSSVNGLLGGDVERIVATQRVEITQPGRRATGERLVYTASDQMFVLTGTAAAPPKVVDVEQGSTTGAVLRFHSGDNSVVVAGRDGDAREGTDAGRVHTETRVKQ
jgi:lipopolysaccharide export system protein LptA